MGMSFDLTGNALAQLQQLINTSTNTKPVMNDIGAVLVSRIKHGFRTSTDPWGQGWKPLKRRKGQPLIDTGRLLASMTYNASDSQLVVGTNVTYAPYQHFGFSNGRAVVPARPFLPITPQRTVDLPANWQADITDIITRHWRSA